MFTVCALLTNTKRSPVDCLEKVLEQTVVGSVKYALIDQKVPSSLKYFWIFADGKLKGTFFCCFCNKINRNKVAINFQPKRFCFYFTVFGKSSSKTRYNSFLIENKHDSAISIEDISVSVYLRAVFLLNPAYSVCGILNLFHPTNSHLNHSYTF